MVIIRFFTLKIKLEKMCATLKCATLSGGADCEEVMRYGTRFFAKNKRQLRQCGTPRCATLS